MGAQVFADSLRRKAAALRDTARLLRESGEDVAAEIRRNIDARQNAGEYRVDDTGTIPGEPFQPLAAYTVAKREAEGIHHDHPLKATGDTYRSIGVRGATDRRVIVGPRTGTGRFRLRKQLGSGVSSDLKRPIPPRNPIGYGRATWEKVAARWKTAFGVDSSTTTRIEIKV